VPLQAPELHDVYANPFAGDLNGARQGSASESRQRGARQLSRDIEREARRVGVHISLPHEADAVAHHAVSSDELVGAGAD